jgi:hypothetical protein
MELSADEVRAVKRLRKLAKEWPDTLWLFSASGILNVMRKGADGEQAHLKGSGVNPDFIVDVIDIPNDGGDW